MKNSGRCSQWNFTKIYCTYTCHTLSVYSPPKVPLRLLPQTFLRIPKQHFGFVSSPKSKPTQSVTIVLTLWIYRTEVELQSCILVWHYSKKRCVHCNKPIVRTLGGHSHIHGPCNGDCILHIVESFRSYSTIEEK